MHSGRSRYILAMATAMLLVSGCGAVQQGASPEASGNVVFVSYGGSYQDAQTKAWLDPFHGANAKVKVIQDSPTDYSKLKTMVDAGQPTWDVVDVQGDFGLESDAKWLEPIDYGQVDKTKIQAGFADKYRVADILFSVVLAYNKKVLGDKVPGNWSDFFDTVKFPGKRALQKGASSGALEIALLADGVSPQNLYPIDVPRALRKLDSIKKSIIWWDTGQQSQDLISTGEVSMAMTFNGRAFKAIQAGAPIGIQWNQQLVSADYLVVPKGAPDKANAMKLIAFITSARPQSDLTKYISYGPVNVSASPDPSTAQYLPTAHMAEGFTWKVDWWAVPQNFSAVDQAYQSWLLK